MTASADGFRWEPVTWAALYDGFGRVPVIGYIYLPRRPTVSDINVRAFSAVNGIKWPPWPTKGAIAELLQKEMHSAVRKAPCIFELTTSIPLEVNAITIIQSAALSLWLITIYIAVNGAVRQY